MQQVQHVQISQQMQEFIGSQQQQLEGVDHRLSKAEQKLVVFGQELEGVRESYREDVGSLEQRQKSTENRLLALETGIQNEISEGCHRIANLGSANLADPANARLPTRDAT